MIRLVFALCLAAMTAPAEVIRIDTPMAPPEWAHAQRALLKASVDAAEEFHAKYIDVRGHFRGVERWGGNDGPDDVTETFHNWPLAYALGGDAKILRLYEHLWEGHLDQFQRAKAPSTEMAKDGMYWREFVTAFDWEHTGEGLAPFYHFGLCRPQDILFRQRSIRYANFYNGDDPQAHNYDKQHKIVRSLHNGSRGSKITPASVFDWGGEVVPGDDRHGRYETASNIRGDHPLNLLTTTLGMNAYMLGGGTKYRDWVLEYATAWRDRIVKNGGNIPTNIGLDGTIGGEWGGKWYGGTFGWDFWPQSNSRNYYMRGVRIAMGNAFLLTRDPSYFEPLRKQIDNLYAVKKEENGRILLPNKHGDQGWYGYTPNQHFDVQRDLYLFTMDKQYLARLAPDPWISYLLGKNPNYPNDALRGSLGEVRRKVKGFRDDDVPPDMRASDHAQRWNPVVTTALVNLMNGANEPGGAGSLVHFRLRYFDPARRRPGVPEDVAALVDSITDDAVTVTLINLNPLEDRDVIVQTGAYAEHTATSVTIGDRTYQVNGTDFTVRLAHGSGARLRVGMRRYANQPVLSFPWDRR
ncbi:MAG: hypothetical protein IPM24_09175 [Bryobacterales bacterium]|nr:hypothetical protein [Bryobacterales bacterium]